MDEDVVFFAVDVFAGAGGFTVLVVAEVLVVVESFVAADVLAVCTRVVDVAREVVRGVVMVALVGADEGDDVGEGVVGGGPDFVAVDTGGVASGD